MAEYIIKELEFPRSEVVCELIRCKDCRKSQYDTVFRQRWCDGRKVTDFHYCGYAERREDG